MGETCLWLFAQEVKKRKKIFCGDLAGIHAYFSNSLPSFPWFSHIFLLHGSKSMQTASDPSQLFDHQTNNKENCRNKNDEVYVQLTQKYLGHNIPLSSGYLYSTGPELSRFGSRSCFTGTVFPFAVILRSLGRYYWRNFLLYLSLVESCLLNTSVLRKQSLAEIWGFLVTCGFNR